MFLCHASIVLRIMALTTRNSDKSKIIYDVNGFENDLLLNIFLIVAFAFVFGRREKPNAWKSNFPQPLGLLALDALFTCVEHSTH